MFDQVHATWKKWYLGSNAFRTMADSNTSVSYSINADDSLSVSVNASTRGIGFVVNKSSEKRIVSASNVTRLMLYSGYENDATLISSVAQGLLIPANTSGFVALRFDTVGENSPVNVQIEVDDTASDFDPYSGTTLSVTFPDSAGTVYGGTVDLVSGVLTVDRAIEIFDGTESWSTSTIGSSQVFVTSRKSITAYSPFISNLITRVSSITYSSDNVGYAGGSYLNVKMTSVLTKDDFVALLTETPLQIVYELSTPIEIQLTPQEINTLIGVNNIWADTGDVSVKYRTH